jgi:hypothetical protein
MLLQTRSDVAVKLEASYSSDVQFDGTLHSASVVAVGGAD